MCKRHHNFGTIHCAVSFSKSRWLSLVFVCGGLLLMSTYAAANDKVYYRYINDEGVKVLNATVPPEYVKYGYEVVTITGRVLEVVPPALTEEQKAANAKRREREARLAEWDESLLKRFSSVEDIEATKRRKLDDFDASLSILRGNANNVNAQIVQAQARAAEAERAGRQVPPAILNDIENLQQKLRETEIQIEKREQEKQETAEQYDLDAERFQEIKPQS